MTEREKLIELQSENLNLELDIYEAKRAGDFARIKFLKLRESELPNELFAQKVLALREEIAELQAENEADLVTISESRQASARFDAETVPQIAALKAEINRLTQLSLQKLAKPAEVEDSLRTRTRKINELKRQLEAM